LSSEKWTARGAKAKPITVDRALILDSENSDNNVLSTLAEIKAVQDLPNGIVVRSEADMPDSADANTLSITGTVGSPANFNYSLIGPTSTIYEIGQTIKINGSTEIIEPTIVNAGANYTTGTPTVTLGPPDLERGVQATAIVTVNPIAPFEILTFVLTFAGTGYTKIPSLVLDETGTGGSGGILTVSIDTNNFTTVYDQFALISTVGVNTFTATTLAGAPINLIGTENGTGILIRCLEKDTEYQVVTSIATEKGYRLVDATRLSIVVVLGPENRITVSNGATFLIGRLVRGLAFQNIIVQAPEQLPPFPETYFDIEGDNNPLSAIITWRDTSVQGFGNLGRVDGASFACADAIFPAYAVGFTITNSIINIANVGYLPFAGTFSSFLTINNIQEGLISPISQSVLPYTVTMTNLTALNAGNETGVNINPATPLTNTFSITNTTKPIGGEMFKAGSSASSSLISSFSGTPNSLPTIVTTDSPHGLVDGQTIEISRTTNYNGRFVISSASGSVLTIQRVFIADDGDGDLISIRKITLITDGGTVNLTALSYADNGRGGTIVSSLGIDAEFINGRRVTIEATTNYNGTFKIFNVIDTVSFEIMKKFEATELSGGTGKMELSDLTIVNSNLALPLPLLIDESIAYDEGVIGSLGGVNLVTVDLPFTATGTGIVTDGSLDERAKNVLVNTVSGEINSKANGSVLSKGTGISVTLDDNLFHDFNLGVIGNAAVEGSDNELFRLTNDVTGEIEYRGEEPFKGRLSFTGSIVSSGSAVDHTFRVVKNGGIMVDNYESAVSIGSAIVSQSFDVPISAEKGDKFRGQFKRDGGNGSATIQNLSTIIQ